MKIIGLLLCKRFVQNYSNLGIHSKIYVPQESLYRQKLMCCNSSCITKVYNFVVHFTRLFFCLQVL